MANELRRRREDEKREKGGAREAQGSVVRVCRSDVPSDAIAVELSGVQKLGEKQKSTKMKEGAAVLCDMSREQENESSVLMPSSRRARWCARREEKKKKRARAEGSDRLWCVGTPQARIGGGGTRASEARG